jgi:hypothetical protein
VEKYSGRMWSALIWFMTGTDGSCCEHCNEPSVSVQAGQYAVLNTSIKMRKILSGSHLDCTTPVCSVYHVCACLKLGLNAARYSCNSPGKKLFCFSESEMWNDGTRQSV